MAIQTTYNLNPPVAYEGMIADSTIVKEVVSRANQGGAIAAGRFVVCGSTDTTAKLPTASGDLATGVGIVMFGQLRPPVSYGGTLWNSAQFAESMPVLRKGHIWVLVEETVAQNDPVFVRYASGGGGSNLGAFRKSADTATAGQIINGSGNAVAKYLTSATSGNLAVVEINLP